MAGFVGRQWLCIAGVALTLAGGCAPIYQNHGYVPSQEVLDEIVVGIDTRDSVAETAGSPSASGVLQDSAYYYVRSRIRSFGAADPEVVEREVLAISFDARGVVQNIERFGLEDGRVVTLERRITDSGTVDRTFIRQLLRNFGRITPPENL